MWSKGCRGAISSSAEIVFPITVDRFPATLVFSSLGYETKEMTVKDAADILNVAIGESATGLDEVVGPGLGTSINKIFQCSGYRFK